MKLSILIKYASQVWKLSIKFKYKHNYTNKV